jgi:hypothetical protein
LAPPRSSSITTTISVRGRASADALLLLLLLPFLLGPVVPQKI